MTYLDRNRCDLKILNNVKSSLLTVSLRAIFRSQRPRAGIFRSPYADLKIGARKGRDLKILNNVKSSRLTVSLRAIFRSQRPWAGIFRSPYADLKIGARKAEI